MNDQKKFLVEQYINSIIVELSSLGINVTEEQKTQVLDNYIDYDKSLDEIKSVIDKLKYEVIEKYNNKKEYLNNLKGKFQGVSSLEHIEDKDISNMSMEELENEFYHYAWKKFSNTYDEIGMKPYIGENSKGVDHEKSIFFSKGLEGCLELWDVWLKWRLNRLNDPRYRGNTQEEIEANLERYRKGLISEEERHKYYYWVNFFENKKFLDDPKLLESLFEYQITELQNSDYYTLDLKEGEEYNPNQIDIKKQNGLNSKGGTNKMQLLMYGEYSDFTTPIADKWNMQTIPGKDVTIDQDRLKRLTNGQSKDALSIIEFMYDKYQREVPKDKQVKFDLLDQFMAYCKSKNHEEKKDIASEDEKIAYLQTVVNSLIEKEVLENSVLLIGPMGVGKSTIADDLVEKLNLPRISLDDRRLLKQFYAQAGNFKNFKDFELYLTTSVLTQLKEPAIIDFGAGHSVYENPQYFTEFQKLVNRFNNVELIMPSEDKQEALDATISVLERRNPDNLEGKISTNKHFIESPCNEILAKDVVITKGKDVNMVSDEIVSNVNSRSKTNNELDNNNDLTNNNNLNKPKTLKLTKSNNNQISSGSVNLVVIISIIIFIIVFGITIAFLTFKNFIM